MQQPLSLEYAQAKNDMKGIAMNIYVIVHNGSIDSAFCVEKAAVDRLAELGSGDEVKLVVTQLYGVDKMFTSSSQGEPNLPYSSRFRG